MGGSDRVAFLLQLWPHCPVPLCTAQGPFLLSGRRPHHTVWGQWKYEKAGGSLARTAIVLDKCGVFLLVCPVPRNHPGSRLLSTNSTSLAMQRRPQRSPALLDFVSVSSDHGSTPFRKLALCLQGLLPFSPCQLPCPPLKVPTLPL